ncbi:MAG: hypothetical protein IJ733_08035, partial [Lachnospiraceae bacterium]|nr:hypothetical protein [Lachnospiraceae bacterium]
KEGSTKIVVSVKFQQKKKIKSKKLICSVVVEGKKEDSVQTNPPSWSKDDGVPHNTTEENEFQKILLRTNSNNEIGYEWENGLLKSLMVQIKTDGSAQEGTEKNESLTGGISGSLDMTVFPELRELYCGVNQITSLNVKNNAKLEKLECPGNRLTELDISQNTELKILYCGTNPIKSLDVANCPNLLQLWCMDNELTELDVSHNTKLQNFWCYNNSLQVLDVSQNLEVNDLRCDGNQIKSLDVSGHAMLRVLDCSDNQLEKLKLGQNAKLEYLTCDHNQLQVLDVSDCEKLVSIKYDEDKVVLNGWKN